MFETKILICCKSNFLRVHSLSDVVEWLSWSYRCSFFLIVENKEATFNLSYLSSCSPRPCVWQPSMQAWCPTLWEGGSVWSAAKASLITRPHWLTMSLPLGKTCRHSACNVPQSAFDVMVTSSSNFTLLSSEELCQTASSPSGPTVSFFFLKPH